MRRMALPVVAILLALAVAGMLYIRSVGHDPALWHVDPTQAERTGKPNDVLVAPEGGDIPSPVYAETPEALMRAFDAVATAQPRVSVVAGDPAEAFVTYVQRSRLVGYPDYISVKAVPAEGGAALAIWSRSRFGYSDMGVNRARIEDWLAQLAAAQG
jgi:uncharacterized protein (DUF1499 family)